MKRIYLASSWRNPFQPEVLASLRAAGHEVYDFRNPAPGDTGFGWRQIDPAGPACWDVEAYRKVLQHPVAQRGFGLDFGAMQWAEEFCLLLPCGRSAHLEAGWAIGQGKRTSVFIPKLDEPELMYLTGGERTRICADMTEVLAFHAEPTVGLRPDRFDCPTCWIQGVMVDEDGCCKMCGVDAISVTDGKADWP